MSAAPLILASALLLLPLPDGADGPPKPDLEELSLVLSDPRQLEPLVRHRTAPIRQMILGTEAPSRPPRLFLSAPTLAWFQMHPTHAAMTVLPLFYDGETDEAAGGYLAGAETLAEALVSRDLVRAAIGAFPPEDARLRVIVDEALPWDEYTAAAEALLRLEPEESDYFQNLLPRVDPILQWRAAAALLERIEDAAVVDAWLDDQPEAVLSLVAWELGGFSSPHRVAARSRLERLRPTVDWDEHLGGARRRAVVEFCVGFLTGLAPSTLDRAAFPFFLDLVAETEARQEAEAVVTHHETESGFVRVSVSGVTLTGVLIATLRRDHGLTREVLLRGGGDLSSTSFVAQIVAGVEGDASFFRSLLDELSLERQPLLVVEAVAKLAAAGSVRPWVESLNSEDLERLAELREALPIGAREAVDARLEERP